MDKIIIIIAIVHAYVFAVMFFAQRRLSSRILGFYMLNFVIQSFLFANFHIFGISGLNIVFYLIISGASLCDWPLMYIYIRKMSQENFRFQAKTLLHFIPAVVVFTIQLALFISLENTDRQLLIQPIEKVVEIDSLHNFLSVYSLSVVIVFIQWIAYSTAMIKRLIKHRRNIVAHYSYTEKINLNWLFAFVLIYLLYFSIQIIIFLFPQLHVTESMNFSIICLHIFIIGIWGLRQRDIYTTITTKTCPVEAANHQNHIPAYDIPENNEEWNLTSAPVQDIETPQKSKRQALLSDSQKHDVAQRIKKLIEEDKLFLNPELSLDHLAAEMHIHKNYISFVINDVFNMNFYNFVNRYRIEEAKKMLTDASFDNLSIEGIATSCGYKSRNVFYPVFKKFEGVTPLEYKNKTKN
ncbi:MAG TPA: AraC family transcriptional regulator [Bacteroidales bacterium]|nr:AraC family transcriptional regulator [Bacteroidales bacterium]HQL69857.1 AraC family transcriptional regulator [Bacteroidales bacterium]